MHPPEETLLTFASGEADLPHRVAIEGHLSSCAACRSALGELTLPGASLLRGLEEERPPDRVWQQLLSRIGGPDRAAAVDPLAEFPLPAGAHRELPPVSELNLRWRRAWAPGAYYMVLLRDAGTGSALLLGHMPPGKYFPRHMHPGREDVLVLAGGYEDKMGRYEAGEYTLYPAGSEHRPVTDRDEECWTLTRLEAPIRFLGWRGGLQKLLSAARR